MGEVCSVFFFFSSLCAWKSAIGGMDRAVEVLCARAADGEALLSWVRLALLPLYRSHCTTYDTLSYLIKEDDEEERERFERWGKSSGNMKRTERRMEENQRSRRKLDRNLKYVVW